MSKTHPENWTTREVAYFAGMLSARIGFGDLKQMVDECASANQNCHLYFADLVNRLEPLISADQWQGCVENCSKVFERVNHA
jgi:hypothetical protein